MKTHSLSLIVLGLLITPQAWAQSPAPPQTYSFIADSNMMGPMTVTVHRNGPMELVELATTSGSLHLRVLYDFQAHRLYTLDLSSNLCTTQEYTSPYVPGLHDPVSGSEEMMAQAGSLKTVRKEPVNGIASRLVEADLPDGQGKARLWLEDNYGFPVKQSFAVGKEPEKVMFEMRQISYAPSAPTLFAIPENCTKIAGTTNANGGSAEMDIGVNAQGQATMSSADPGKKAAPKGNPNRLLGKWTFTGTDGAGTQWSGTLSVTKLDQETLDQGQYSNMCDFDLNSGNSGKGAAGACLYEDGNKTLTFASDWEANKFSFTAVLSSDGKSLAKGVWVDSVGKGNWSATSTSKTQPGQ